VTGPWRDLQLYVEDDGTTYGDWFDELRSVAETGREADVFDELVQRGVGLHQAGLDQEALDMLTEAEAFLRPEVVPAEAWPWFANTRGMALSGLGRFAEAHEEYEQMHRLAQKLPDERRRDDIVATALQNQGVNALEQGDAERATPLLARSLDMKRQLEDWVSALDVFTTLAMAVAESGDVLRALDMLDDALEMAQTLEQPRRVAAVLGNQAALEARLGNPSQAEAKLRLVLAFVRAEGDVLRQMQTMQGLGSSLLDQGRPGLGLRWYRKARLLAARTGAAVMHIRLLRNVATALMHLGRDEEAALALQNAVSEAEALGQVALAAATLADLGALYANAGKIDQAEAQLHRALARFEELANAGWQSELKSHLGALAALEGHMEDADALWQEALMLAQDNGPAEVALAHRAAELWMHARGATQTQHWLKVELASAEALDQPAAFAWRTATAGALMGVLGPTESGLDFFTEAARLYEDLEDIGQATRVRLDLGKTLSDLGRHDEALVELRHALADARAMQDRTLQLTAFGNLGEVLRRTGDLAGARDASTQAVSLAQELGDKDALALFLGNLGLVAYALGELDGAAKLFRQQLDLAGQLRHRGHEAAARGGLGSVELALGHPRRAAKLLKRAAALQAGVWPVGEIENLEGLLTALVQSGQTDKLQEPAQRLADSAASAKLADKAAGVFARVGRELLRAGDMEEASSFYNASLRLGTSGEEGADDEIQHALLYALGLMSAHVETDLAPEARQPFYEVFLASLNELEDGLGEPARELLDQVRKSLEEQGVYDDLRRDTDP
jgi:tetratricopeptide (TPR) repeat protein